MRCPLMMIASVCSMLALPLSLRAQTSAAPGVFALSPDGTVLHDAGGGASWQPVGRPFRQLIAGGGRLFAIHEDNDIYELQRDRSRATSSTPGLELWSRIGTPGHQFIVDERGQLCGISPGLGAVYCYDGTPMAWTRVGGPMTKLFVKGHSLFAIGPNSDGIYRYEGKPGAWTRVGPAARELIFEGPRSVPTLPAIVARGPVNPPPIDGVKRVASQSTSGRCYYTTAIRHRCTGIPYDTRLDTEVDEVCNGCLVSEHCKERPGGRCVQIPAGGCVHASRACAYPGDACHARDPFSACPSGQACANVNGRAVCGPMPQSPP